MIPFLPNWPAVIWKLIGTGAALSVLMVGCVMRDKEIEHKGAVRERGKIEKGTRDAAEKGAAAAATSRTGGVFGRRDPYTRD